MVGLIKPASSDTLTSVFSISTAFTTEKYRIVITSLTTVVLKGLSNLSEYMTPWKYWKYTSKWKSQTITLSQFIFLMTATSSRSKEQWRTGSVSALPRLAKPCQNDAPGNTPWCVPSQSHTVNSWNNMVLRPECVWTLIATFLTNAPGPPDIPWHFGHSYPLPRSKLYQ